MKTRSDTTRASVEAARSDPALGSDYVLHSDLARLCLPAAHRDSARRLAWTNSICALFLVIGVIGIRPPQIRTKPLSPPRDIVPIVFMEPEPAPEIREPDATARPPARSLAAAAPAAPTVVVANTPAIAFAVPIKEAAILAPARFAAPPPPRTAPPVEPRVTQFNPNVDVRSTPHPEYPMLALRRGYQGKVVINFVVTESGSIAEADVAASSGYAVLDEAALNVVRNRWRFPAGAIRHHYVEIIFQLK